MWFKLFPDDIICLIYELLDPITIENLKKAYPIEMSNILRNYKNILSDIIWIDCNIYSWYRMYDRQNEYWGNCYLPIKNIPILDTSNTKRIKIVIEFLHIDNAKLLMKKYNNQIVFYFGILYYDNIDFITIQKEYAENFPQIKHIIYPINHEKRLTSADDIFNRLIHDFINVDESSTYSFITLYRQCYCTDTITPRINCFCNMKYTCFADTNYINSHFEYNDFNYDIAWNDYLLL